MARAAKIRSGVYYSREFARGWWPLSYRECGPFTSPASMLRAFSLAPAR